VLDAYAGTGAVGIEALSRGAAHVTFADRDPRALKLIRENLALCGVSDRYVIIRARLGQAPPSFAPEPFDLAVLDPPYDEPDLAAVVIAAEPLLARGGVLILEHARRRPAPALAGGLTRLRDVTSGDSALAFYERVTSDT
jgi:16S rRNA (guanine966-N2)-methyltransferase